MARLTGTVDGAKMMLNEILGDRQPICESSDWFWWFGDYNPSQAVTSFDKLYRRNLINLYHLLKLPPPSQLHLPISRGSQDAEGGTMRRAQEPPL